MLTSNWLLCFNIIFLLGSGFGVSASSTLQGELDWCNLQCKPSGSRPVAYETDQVYCGYRNSQGSFSGGYLCPTMRILNIWTIMAYWSLANLEYPHIWAITLIFPR